MSVREIEFAQDSGSNVRAKRSSKLC